MADENATRGFMPAEWVNGHFRPIGGSYESLDLAVEAVDRHFRNRHGGAASPLIYRPGDAEASGVAALIEAGSVIGDPLQAKALYKVLVTPPAR